jgi:hypothetical protein
MVATGHVKNGDFRPGQDARDNKDVDRTSLCPPTYVFRKVR